MFRAETPSETDEDGGSQTADEPDRPDVAPAGPVDPSRVREIAMQRAASFVDEIRSSLEFYTAQSAGLDRSSASSSRVAVPSSMASWTCSVSGSRCRWRRVTCSSARRQA